MKRITIKDLAKALNISTSTVSRSLSDHPDINAKTKQRVKEAAKALNYRANLHARFFRSKRSKLIALVLPSVNMFFLPNLINAVNDFIASTDYLIITFQSNDDYLQEQEIINQCIDWSVEGVLISLSKNTPNVDHILKIREEGVRCVVMDKSLPSDEVVTAKIDSVAASYKATCHLIENGHKNILGVFGNPSLQISKKRIEGFRKAFKDNNLPVSDEQILSVEVAENIDNVLPLIFKNNPSYTAVFTMSDELLLKTYSNVLAAGLKIPEDISLISISDGGLANSLYPKISHIMDSGYELGKQAVSTLIDLINDDKNVDRKIEIPTFLVEKNSVKKLN